ncbi:MAG: hypothetical protein WC136_04195 [Sphaerochaeta sp.]|nr:hypothetical protein [Sphaerochaeta sp.]
MDKPVFILIKTTGMSPVGDTDPMRGHSFFIMFSGAEENTRIFSKKKKHWV